MKKYDHSPSPCVQKGNKRQKADPEIEVFGVNTTLTTAFTNEQNVVAQATGKNKKDAAIVLKDEVLGTAKKATKATNKRTTKA